MSTIDIPVIDLSLPSAAEDLVRALTSPGFCSLINHGIDATLMRCCFALSHEFFSLPTPTKLTYKYQGHDSNTGYIALGMETHVKKPDCKETLDILATSTPPCPFVTELEDFGVVSSYWKAMNTLQLQLLEWIAQGLQLQDPKFFVDRCNQEHCNLRMLHYPPVPSTDDKATIRGARHTDFGTLTLLIQDETGGLQVEADDGSYVNVPTIPDAIVLNVGDMLQIWTNGKLRATPHRVVDVGTERDRYSIAFFCNANKDVTLEPITFGEVPKYRAINAFEHLKARLQATVALDQKSI